MDGKIDDWKTIIDACYGWKDHTYQMVGKTKLSRRLLRGVFNDARVKLAKTMKFRNFTCQICVVKNEPKNKLNRRLLRI